MDTAALTARLAELYPGVDTLTPAQVREALPTLQAETVTSLQPHTWMEARGLYKTFGAVEGELLVRRMETLAQQDHLLGWIMKRSLEQWITRGAALDGQNAGVDLGDEATRLQIAALTSQVEGDGLPFTAEQAAALLAIGVAAVPRWPGLTLRDLEALYRPAWQAQYDAEQAALATRAAALLAAYEADLEAEHPELWTAYQADPNAQATAHRDALEQADAELRAEGVIRGE